MIRPIYLVYLINPYDLNQLPRFFIKRGRKRFSEISFSDLISLNQTLVISYQLDDLFSLIPKDISLNNEMELVDICQAYKLIFGKSYKGKKGGEPWNIWNLVNHKEYGNSKYVKQLWNYIYLSQDGLTEKALLSNLGKFCLLLEKLWKNALRRLRVKDEYQRYFLFEKPVNEIFLKQHLKGIRISQEYLTKRLDKLDEKISFAGRKLKENYGIRDIKNLTEISQVLSKNGFNSLQINDTSFNSILDLYSNHQELPQLLKIYGESNRDKNILLRLGAINVDRIHPLYKCLGTVTGRILVENPVLQYIKRSNRDVLIADEGKVFLYPDYSQFEPGIMADESGDEVLRNDFNSGDLYKSLSIKLFGQESHRKSAKILFLAFCYGMHYDRMIEYATESSGQSKNHVKKVIESFFGKYKTLIHWRNSLEVELINEKRIGTKLGNYRYRDFRGKQLTEVEKRWVISQRIQGTASLIIKDVVLDINKNCLDIDILLPMHDALLLQVPQNKDAQLRKVIENIFINKFMKYCPSVKPRVVFSDFIGPDDEIK